MEKLENILSPKELEVAGFVAQGLTNSEISWELGVSEQVVKNYLKRVYDKTGTNRVLVAIRYDREYDRTENAKTA